MFAFFALCFALPFLNCARYSPLQDWWTDALVVLAIGLVAPFALRRGSTGLSLPAFAVFLALSALYLSFVNVLLLDNAQGSSQAVASLLAMMLLALWLGNRVEMPLPAICMQLCGAVLLGNCLQVALGLIQALDLARATQGWVLYDYRAPTAIIGNLAQHNQYAQYLFWGLPAACYLYGRRSLGGVWCAALVFILCLMITWSGARLPLAYGLGLCLLAWFWIRRTPADEVLRRMAAALAVSVFLLALVQLFNSDIVWALNKLGVPIQAVSGSERLLDEGFGARRRVEWSKAWLVFQSHPWVGAGLGRYAAQSVWLEAFGAFPLYPESRLFTQSHNLVFQLLAETGALGAALVAAGLLFCLLPFFGKGRQTPENLLLIALAMVLLAHSMFEFPLWYLPFLAMLTTVCALGPAPRWRVPTRTAALRWLCMGSGALMLAYVLSGGFIFKRFLEYSAPSLSVQDNVQRIEYLGRLALNPLWSKQADLVMGNYLLPDRKHLDISLPFYERLAKDQPFVVVLLRLSICRALAGQVEGAREAMAEAIANYPDETPKFVLSLQGWPDPEIRPLREMALRAARAYQAGGPETEAGRLAAVKTVVAPVERRLTF
ncbi:PglL family O-oligosaccharyltransferase [Chromobacterium sp. IIBBL 290-4]|uniref:PglL family O-oligosaccharyltransferase n=1 Tax=Chromobacterium sp. IIBBL 290-4 TaxID=2953890 RepID=UPI0020B7AFE2|nr:O-antigen ligase family protein [Chromobacterium sp. IIBBL 290-4]UTH75439.1 Wzy polymerase domain-containing protein [Chromobacterium sp. IIBBL 290-4]